MTFLEFLAAPAVFTSLAAVFGLAVGSFLNVVIHRLPKMMERDWHAQCAELARRGAARSTPRYNLVTPRSGCPTCGHRITALENVPVVSLPLAARQVLGVRRADRHALPGRRGAHRRRSPRTRPGASGSAAPALGAMLFAWCMIALDVHRPRHAAPARRHHAAAALGRPAVQPARHLRRSPVGGDRRGRRLPRAVVVYWAFKLATGKEGMGYGDFKLLAAIGAWLGWKMLPLVILLSSFVGAVVGIALMVLARRGRDVPDPVRPLPRGRRPDRALLGPGAGRSLPVDAAVMTRRFRSASPAASAAGRSTVARAVRGARRRRWSTPTRSRTSSPRPAAPRSRRSARRSATRSSTRAARSTAQRMRRIAFARSRRAQAARGDPAPDDPRRDASGCAAARASAVRDPDDPAARRVRRPAPRAATACSSSTARRRSRSGASCAQRPRRARRSRRSWRRQASRASTARGGRRRDRQPRRAGPRSHAAGRSCIARTLPRARRRGNRSLAGARRVLSR